MKSSLRLMAVSFCIASFAYPQADANKGQILGTVFDANSAVVPNAEIKITNSGTGLKRELRSNGEGQYRAVQLDPGVYELVATASGFSPTCSIRCA